MWLNPFFFVPFKRQSLLLLGILTGAPKVVLAFSLSSGSAAISIDQESAKDCIAFSSLFGEGSEAAAGNSVEDVPFLDWFLCWDDTMTYQEKLKYCKDQLEVTENWLERTCGEDMNVCVRYEQCRESACGMKDNCAANVPPTDQAKCEGLDNCNVRGCDYHWEPPSPYHDGYCYSDDWQNCPRTNDGFFGKSFDCSHISPDLNTNRRECHFAQEQYKILIARCTRWGTLPPGFSPDPLKDYNYPCDRVIGYCP